ncbi:MAG: cytochrome c-type biogenesis protein [bacterium]
MHLLSLLTLWLFLAASGAAQTLDDRAREIARLLMCPVCEGQTVAESSSELAEQMRALIRERLQQGQGRDEILSYFVSRYGESILAAPPKRGLNLIAWAGPFIVLALAAVIAVNTLRRWTRPSHQPRET